jgi:RecJ-like exonuclease
MSKQHLITTIETCQECHGDGHIIHPAWEQYHDATVNNPNYKTTDPYDTEPMGQWFKDHDYETIPDEEQTCWACGGEGEIQTVSSLADALQDLDSFQFLQERMENAEQWIIALNDALTEARHQKIIASCGLADGFVTDDDGNLVEGLVSAE